MAKNWEEQLGKWTKTWVSTEESISAVAKKSKRAIKQASLKAAYWSGVLVVGFVLAGSIMYAAGLPLTPQATQASSLMTSLATIVGMILYFGAMAVPGVLLAIVGWILELVIGYPWSGFWTFFNAEGFVNVPVVITGWKTVRNVCNVFFSIILVIISLATVLKIEAYSWKQTLPKFVIFAVLINFSKSIAGIFTDVATVAMATFGGSFAGTFASGLITGFGIFSVGNLNPADDIGNGVLATLAAFTAAGIMIWTALAILTVFVVILLIRIVALWILIVLSPIAYITRILPITTRYSSEWWQRFGQWCIMGPLITFFLWLSLSIAFGVGGTVGSGSGTSTLQTVITTNSSGLATSLKAAGVPNTPSSSGFQALEPSTIANFLIMTVLMIFSLSQVKKLAGEAASIIDKASDLTKKGRGAILNMGRRGAVSMGAFTRNRASKKGTTGRVSNGIAGTLDFAARTVLNPELFSGIGKQIVASTEGKNKETQDALDNRANSTMESAAIVKPDGSGVNLGQAAKYLYGAMMVAGGQNGKHIFDNVLSARGVKHAWNSASDIRSGEYEKLAANDQELATATEEYEAEKTRTPAGYSNRAEAQKALDDFIASTKAGANDQAVEITDPAIKGAIQVKIDGLDTALANTSLPAADRASLEAQKAALQGALAGPTTWGALREGGMASEISAALVQARLDDPSDTEAARLRASGIEFGDDGRPKQTFSDMLGAKQARVFDLKNASNRMAQELSARTAGGNTEAVLNRNRQLAEAEKDLGNIKDSQDLRQFMYRARNEGNQAMVEAVLKRITTNGDENELFGKWAIQDMQGDNRFDDLWKKDADGRILGFDDQDPAKKARLAQLGCVDDWGNTLQPGSDARGQELFRRQFMVGQMGWDQQDSMRAMAYNGMLGESIGHFGIARAYEYRGDRVQYVHPDIRSLIVQGEKSKMKFSGLAQYNRLAFLAEDGVGNFSKMLGETAGLLNNFSQELTTPHYFKQLTANTRSRMSEPQVIRQMVTNNVNPSVIASFMHYGQTAQNHDYSDILASNKHLSKELDAARKVFGKSKESGGGTP
ncbi:MAG: hypothetical protein COW24_06065 [Candidatus Kerfeldbacteria bacterium CG15_BIG_FIL_POST_REV_8_21_14_020_45_12]|uniref:Uncharacterized protein n=1 Tax=Candidatus Kerfeldbacteria bacterium CG15_BIG_FIL_POST_REV_8_21_14_020_45_12 TaxID=2014247 RepID=A0A2M7H230_9BACT|nr:MAG: hypothetical protein COW24_06065 [Candidatus Kerfeldbacteria bacterium CG15_BIG_FIL_POST_REV_8_21_14_020_45_12]PJA92890.1 MAG: hypothetical protein CO132_05845 [Candidatus Kerfeldbacteria bacterium CG_4_9_14_3_um_filter_45_8]